MEDKSMMIPKMMAKVSPDDAWYEVSRIDFEISEIWIRLNIDAVCMFSFKEVTAFKVEMIQDHKKKFNLLNIIKSIS